MERVKERGKNERKVVKKGKGKCQQDGRELMKEEEREERKKGKSKEGKDGKTQRWTRIESKGRLR